MTSEVCVMNRLAVVLAADSATTVTRYTDQGRQEERYFKGANKIFQVSDHHAIGMMVFDNADLLRVPWELIAKEYRKQLGVNSFNHVHEYAEDFFTFLDNSSWLFPAQVQKSKFLEAARGAAFQLGMQCTPTPKPGDPIDQQALDEQVAERRRDLDNVASHPCVTEDMITEILGGWVSDLLVMLEDFRSIFGENYPTDLKVLAEAGILSVVKDPLRYLETTGLVFAGFGNREIFPAMTEYVSSGILLGKCLRQHKNTASLDHDLPAWLSAFAQTSMYDTFSLGISEEAYGLVMNAVDEALTNFSQTIAAATGADLNLMPNLAGDITQATSAVGSAVLSRLQQANAVPLRSVLSVLPVDEMAELAETLINLQSLKEKVTKPSETVGGPVDVAVITRGEGLVWIKRKHFFDPKLNTRYLQRQAATYR